MKHVLVAMMVKQRAWWSRVRCESSYAKQKASSSIAEGQVLRLEHAFHQEDVEAYAAIAGDSNPIHTSPSVAASAGFPSCLVHGMLCASLFPSLFASRLPDARIESKTVRFKHPAFVGDCLEAEATVLSVYSTEKCLRIEFNLECYKKQGRILVLEGNSKVVVPQL